MNKLYVAVDRDGNISFSTHRFEDWGDGTWDVKEKELGDGLFFGLGVHNKDTHPRREDYRKIIPQATPSFIKPGTQWVRELVDRVKYYEIDTWASKQAHSPHERYTLEQDANNNYTYTIYKWTLFDTLEEKKEEDCKCIIELNAILGIHESWNYCPICGKEL